MVWTVERLMVELSKQPRRAEVAFADGQDLRWLRDEQEEQPVINFVPNHTAHGTDGMSIAPEPVGLVVINLERP